MFKRLDKIQEIDRRFGVAERTDDARQRIVQVGCRNTGEYEENVAVRAVNNIVRRLHPNENLACHQADDHGHDHGKTGGDPSGISDETAHVLVILCAEPLCNRNGKPGADADDETVNHKVDGGGGTDRSQCIDTEKFSNNDRIDHVVKLLEQKSHQHRNRKAQNPALPGSRLSYLLW